MKRMILVATFVVLTGCAPTWWHGHRAPDPTFTCQSTICTDR